VRAYASPMRPYRIFLSCVLFLALFELRSIADARSSASAASPAVGGAASFTLAQALSAPFPTELTAAPAKDRIAWAFDQEGRHNIWFAERTPEGGWRDRQLTHYSDDDGQEVAELAWTPDAEAIVYSRGGDFNQGRAPYPNPANRPGAIEQAVWVVSVAGGTPRKLGEGHLAAVSPKGDTVAYLLKGQIWEAALNGSEKPKQWVQASGSAGSLRWSPAGGRLAFVSHRGDHSFIGIVDVAAGTVVYADPSVDTDGDPVWSPDGRKIAFLRIPASSDRHRFVPNREGQPWSIRVADVATGEGREVWRAERGRGSVFYEIVAENAVFWGAEDRIVFPWERDGWNHLYSAPVSGGPAKLLTPGEFEVETAALSPDRRRLVYSSNQDDIDRRHAWSVSVGGEAPPAAVTSGGGVETTPVVLSDGTTVAVLSSDARWPMRPAAIAGGGKLADVAADAVPTAFPAAAFCVPQQVIFAAADGMQIHGQLFLPPGGGDGARRPALVFSHGGPRRQMLLGWHYMEYYNNAYAMNQYLASRGYIVLAVNYRTGIGYGLDFREALGSGRMGASEFNDLTGAGAFLRNRPDVNPKQIGLWGGSYGGYMTALGLARASELFAAGVDMHGVHEWNDVTLNFDASYRPDADEARLAWESSPLAAIKTWRSPVLLIHGDDDRNVPFAETVKLVEALREQGVEFEQRIFPGEVHDFLLHRTWISAYGAAADFFDRHLKPPGRALADEGDRLKLEPNDPKPRYLSSIEIAQAFAQIGKLEYPATQSEVYEKIGTVGHNLPVLGVFDRSLNGPGGMRNRLQISLTDSDDPHRHYLLYIWLSRDSENLSGPAFKNGRFVGYAEIVLVDNDLHATFVIQSNRYPYRNVSYPTRLLRYSDDAGSSSATGGKP